MKFDESGCLICPHCKGIIVAHITQRYVVEIGEEDVLNKFPIVFADGLYKTTEFYYCRGCGKKWKTLIAIKNQWRKKHSG